LWRLAQQGEEAPVRLKGEPVWADVGLGLSAVLSLWMVESEWQGNVLGGLASPEVSGQVWRLVQEEVPRQSAQEPSLVTIARRCYQRRLERLQLR
jgi:hypothetical protein